MIIDNFLSGLNTQMNAYAIPPSACTSINNAEIRYNSIRSINAPVATEYVTNYDFFYIFNDNVYGSNEYTSFVEYNNNLYYKTKNSPLMCVYRLFNSDTREYEYKEYSTKIEVPVDRIDKTFIQEDYSPELYLRFEESFIDTANKLPPSTYKYKAVYTYGGQTIFSKTYTATITTGTAILITCPKQSSYILEVYREYAGIYRRVCIFYPSEENSYIDNEENIASSQKETIVQEKDKTKVFQYLYAYYNEDIDIEGDYSAISPEFSLDVTKAYGLSRIRASKDTNVTHIHIYRVGGLQTKATLVGKIKNDPKKDTLEYIDIIADPIVEKTLNSKKKVSHAPDELEGICLYNGSLFGFEKNIVYYSQTGKLELWNKLDSFTLPSECTGITSFRDGVLCFTKTSTSLIQFYNDIPYFFSIDDTVGCASKESCRSVRGLPVWYDGRGISFYYNGEILSATEEKIDLTGERIVSSAVYDAKYFFTSKKDVIYVIDFSRIPSLPITKIFANERFDYIVACNGSIYVGRDGYIYKLFCGGQLDYEYTTGYIPIDMEYTAHTYSYITVVGKGNAVIEIDNENSYIAKDIFDFGEEGCIIKKKITLPTSFAIKVKIKGRGEISKIIFTEASR